MRATTEPEPPSRRDAVRRAAALGIAAAPVSGLLGGCAAGGGSGVKQRTGVRTAVNPFGVPHGAPLDVVIFNGGFGDGYARRCEKLYADRHPEAEVSHTATQDITGLLQPRLNAGNPPDVVDDSGNQQIKLNILRRADQLADLTPLLDAPSFDDPGRTVRDILLPGTVELGTIGGAFVSLQYVYTVYGLWYSSRLFREHGWSAPRTWADFLSLGRETRKAGVALFAHPGKYPYYVNVVIMDLAIKNGGLDFLRRVDALDETVWDEDAPRNAVEAVYEIVSRNCLLPGTNGMTHIESQTAWNRYQAAFVPCGAWLENEQLRSTPADFGITFTPLPSLPGDKLPFTAIRGGASEPFIVPKRARNAAGGMEFLRVMLSRAGAEAFARTANSLTVVKDGIGDGVRLRPGTRSAVAALRAAGRDVFNPSYPQNAGSLDVDMGDASGELMANRIRPAEWLRRVRTATVNARKA